MKNRYIIKTWEVPGVKVPKPNERILKVLFSPFVGNKQLTLLISLVDPNSTTGLHDHDVDEYMYVVSGHGIAINLEENIEVEVHPDMLVYAPAKTKHEMKNTSDETLKLVCIYVPPLKPVEQSQLWEAERKAETYFSEK